MPWHTFFETGTSTVPGTSERQDAVLLTELKQVKMCIAMGKPEAGVLLQNTWGGRPDSSSSKQALHHHLSQLCGEEAFDKANS